MNEDDGSSQIEELSADLAALVRAVEELRGDLDDIRGLVDELQLAMAAGVRSALVVDRVYADWQTWVDEWLTLRISRSPQRFRWCARYAEHPEVADRLEALWYAWEAAWTDPVARLGWFRDSLDHHLAVVSAEDGPLRGCSSMDDQHEL